MKKLCHNLLLATVGTGMLTALSASAAPAKLQDLNVLTVEFKLQFQGSFADDGSVRTYTNPTVEKFGTKDLLSLLAADKYAQTNYPANFFPNGSKLAVTSSGAVVVVNKNDELLVDVSDVIRFAISTNGILSGKVDNTTGLARPKSSEQAIVQMTYDDTFITNGANFSFVIQGLDKIKTNDTQPGQAGNYFEISKDVIANAAGEGQSAGTRFVVTGNIQGNGKKKLSLAPN